VISLLCLALAPQAPTVGAGDLAHRAVGPSPAFVSQVGRDYVLVKNWDFGAKGTIRNMTDMSREFMYRDQFKTIANGTNYGAVMIATDAETRLEQTPTGPQPIEDPKHPARRITADSLKTFLVPLNGATTCAPGDHNVGCGSFTAKWSLPLAGSHLGQDILWETRVRMVTPPYYWFALWNAGTKWDKGAEIDLIEGFGYDNGDGRTNFDGRYWHSNPVGGTEEIDYWKDWSAGMKAGGVPTYDATKYHVWQLLYRKDDTYACFVDGHEVQRGKIPWTLRAREDGEPLDFFFLFDAGWGHTQVKSVNKPLPASVFEGKFYEFDYSRVYLRR